MSIGEILYSILIEPLQLFFELIYVSANYHIHHPGISIIVLSLVMNILVLPLYRRADLLQEEERDIEAKLAPGIAHIKKVFKGDEKMMMLRTYYRQNHYMPTDAIKGLLPLFLQIPFFIAAYQFLSHLPLLQGVPFGPVQDLGAPDGLLTLGGTSINVLPFLMTAVNLISNTIFVQGYPLKTKVQLYAMALFFLVFLYPSPAGLVFYWTLNNLFSLVKTIIYKVKNPDRLLAYILSAGGILCAVYGVFFLHDMARYKAYMVLLGLFMQLRLLRQLGILKKKEKKADVQEAPSKGLFLLASLFLVLLMGVLIPSAVIQTSPQEFVDPEAFRHPLWYVASTLFLFIGTFFVWLRIFYTLSDEHGKVLFERVLWCFCGVGLTEYMFFGTGFGTLSATLQYQSGMFLTTEEKNINLAVIVVAAVAMYFILRRFRKITTGVLVTAVLAVSVMSAMNLYDIHKDILPLQAKLQEGNLGGKKEPYFSLSTKGKNVIVLMLDRAMGPYIPYLFAEKPELREQFAGFTYYHNTLSFGGNTNFGSPALYGGYEYTPIEINKRKDESLASKQNEALKVMPVLFDKNGYDVTVCNPTYANYQWIPDVSIFDEYPSINAWSAYGKFYGGGSDEEVIRRNFYFYGFMKTTPLLFSSFFYDGGHYNKASKMSEFSRTTLDFYNFLDALPRIGRIQENEKNTLFVAANDFTHSQVLLQEPDYVPTPYIDNEAYDAAHKDRFTLDGRTMKVETEEHYAHYQVNMAAMLVLGKWFDYLRANNLYDNTRIILVADHGYRMEQFEELLVEDGGQKADAEGYAPLLMVKDFNSHELVFSDEFMTNGDVPTLATAGLIENPINPFTGKLINSNEKTAHDQYVFMSHIFSVTLNNGNQFLPGPWFKVHSNIWDKTNWHFVSDDAILTEAK